MVSACGLAILASACTNFVKPEARAQSVRVAAAGDVKGCSKIGHAAVTVPYKFGFIHRSASSVADDLQTLGRNSAVDMHGDTIVATGRPSDGNQAFDVYRCRQ
jgi:hypothetical protein